MRAILNQDQPVPMAKWRRCKPPYTPWWGTFVAACFAASASSIAGAFDAPQPTTSLPVVSGCTGVCVPTLVRLDDGKWMITWIGDELVPWAQAVDVRGGRLLGAPVQLGEIMTTTSPSYLPLAIPVPGGDLVLVGGLADGRLTVMRGSETATRRFAPTVVRTPDELEVLDVSATAAADGFAILLLRGPHMEDLAAPRSAMDVELLWLGAHGELTRPPMRWKSESGTAPQMAVCQGQLYLAWQANRGVVATTISPSFERSAEKTFRYRRGAAAFLGPIICSDTGARLFAAWRKSAISFELAPVLNIAELSPLKGSTSSLSGAWRTMKLPDLPTVSHGRIAVQVNGDGLHVAIERAGSARIVTMPSLKNTRVARQLALPANADCLPTADGQQVACVEAQTVRAKEGSCPKFTTQIRFSYHGAVAPPPAPSTRHYEYWTTGPVRDARAPAHWQLEREKTLVRCTTPNFHQLRDALREWCGNTATKPADAESYAAFCAPDEPASLLSQATSCTDAPTPCESPTLASVPSVDRVEFERGVRVEFTYMNCSVWFSRGAKSWRVVDHECTGE